MMPPAGVSPDYEQAYNFNVRGFAKGNFEGASNIALLYENGWGVKKDFNVSATWYQKVIDSDMPHSAQAELGLARLHRKKLIQGASSETAKKLCKEAIRVIDIYKLSWPAQDENLREAKKCLTQAGFVKYK